jgi:AsmA-like C-terminal region
MLKKILKITGITLVVLIGLLIAAPYIFKDKIVKIVKEQINKNINANADFKDVSLSFFRHFPKVSLALEGLQVVGRDDFSKDTLISAKELDVAVDLFSVIGGSDMKVHSITINEPRIHAIVHADGKANWDITIPDTSTVATPAEESKPFKMNLQKYAINNAYIKYDDEVGGMSSEIVNLTHEGSGDFTSDLFTLQTETKADAITFTYGGIPYLNNTKTSIDLDIQIDNSTSKYTFKTDEILLNDLKIATEGFFQMATDSTYNMDIKFNAPSTDFKSILSLVPAVYQKDFANIKTSGKALFNGFVKGTYSNTQIPAYNINLDIQDGFFQYPDLPKPVKNINVTVKVDNPDGVTDNTVVDIPKGHIEFGNDPFDFRLLLKKPLTDQYIDAAAKGKLDLAGITQMVKLEGTKLSGMVNADVQAKGNVSVIAQQKPGQFSAKGFIDISNLFYSSKAFPQPIQNTSAKIIVDNPDGVPDHTVVQIPAAHVEIGKDVVDATLLLKTPASDPYFDGTAKGSFNLGNVAQFYTFPAGTSLAGLLNADVSFKGKKSFIDKSQYDAIQTAGTVTATNVVYKSSDYPDGVSIKDSRLTFNPKNVTINNVSGNFMGTNFNANGSFDNLIGYALKDEALTGTLNVNADKADLNKWMGTTTTVDTAAATTSEPFAVPKNIQLTLNTKVDNVKYDKVDYSNIDGQLQIKNETVSLNNVKMNALDGTIALSGSYSTLASKKKPDISLSYDVQNLDIQKTFLAFNTVQKLMPIGKFIAGKLTSKMTMKGKLGEDMMPDLGTLTGEGNLLLLQGFLSKFAPLEKMANTLNISELQQISIKDIKNYFEFANGKILVKPFTVKIKDIDMEIGGMHGIDQSIDYAVNLKVPREKLGEKANQFVNGLASQANSKGIPVKLSDVINLKVNMGGTITNPTIKTDLANSASSLAQDMKDQAKQMVEAKKAAADSVIAATKSAAKDTLASVKKELAKAAGDELKKQLFGKDTTATKDTTAKDPKKKAEESIKGLLKGFGKKKAADTTKH